MVEKVIHGQINASSRIIGDISVGIYRSPANALKELISNAFDAGASEVVINTDHPGFTGVTCYDNGPGMSVEELQEVFSYIGGSDKRSRTPGTRSNPGAGVQCPCVILRAPLPTAARISPCQLADDGPVQIVCDEPG